MSIIITTGKKYADIDALACIVADNELLSFDGKKATNYIPGVLNQSVSKTVLTWPFEYVTEIGAKDENQFIVMDVSDPEHIAPGVNHEQVIEVYDHHHGFEQYWKDKIGEKAVIEMIGAAATLIWEEFINRGHAENISTTSANFLYTGIISNTLNFKASVTDQRDITAAEQLSEHTNLPPNWIEIYYREQDEMLLADIEKAVHEDTKVQYIDALEKELVIGQMELWDSKAFVHDHATEIKATLETYDNPDWFMTAPSISEGKNYFYSESEMVKELLKEIMEATFDGDFGTTPKLWLRKEILKELNLL